MGTFRFDLNDEYSEQLENDAKTMNLSVQDYIRYKLFDKISIFTVDEAVKRIQRGNFENVEFTLPDVYGEEWTIQKGAAGVFGKDFNNYIIAHPELGIRYLPERAIKRRAVYIYNKFEED